MAKRKAKLYIEGMWFFSKSREEQQKHQKCSLCDEIGIFSNDYMRTWFCGIHMREVWNKQDDRRSNQTNL